MVVGLNSDEVSKAEEELAKARNELYNFDFAHDVNFSKQKLAAEPCDSCDSFFEKHILADTIAYFYTETLYEEI